MNFRIVTDSKKWDQFVAAEPHSQFLQSWSWGEFQKAYGRRVWRVGMFAPRHSDPRILRGEESRSSSCEILRRFAPQDDVLVGAAQIIEHYLGLGMGYLYSPRGPIFSLSFRAERGIPTVNESGIRNQELGIRELIEFLKKGIINYGTLFLRVEPADDIQYPISNIQYFHVPSIQPAHVLLLDLSKSEEELLAGMHPKTRYNIRLAERKGLEFENVILNGAKRSEESFSHFWFLFRETAKRDKIRLHPKKYYEQMNKILAVKDSNIQYSIFNIQYLNHWLAAGIFIGFGSTFAYVHGASSSQHREMMAPHLLHWQAIKFAKNQGYRYYDFGGINPQDRNDFDYRSSWEGITRFKRGFGGFIKSYFGTYDAVLNEWGYRLFQLGKKVKKFWPS